MNALSGRKTTKYASSAAPKESSPGLFPKLDNVVTVEVCHYYLSLMEQFMRYKKTFNTSLLKIMLSRAEARYARWRDVTKSSFAKVSQEVTPPIDVAYMWHVHMLSPLRYYEDGLRLLQENIFHMDLPLHAIHQGSMSTSELEASALKWKQYFGSDEPYIITPYNVTSGTAEVLCCYCKSGIECSWIEYANWRFNPTTIIACPQCHSKTSAHISSVAKLISDIDRGLIAGMMLDTNGTYEPEQAQKRKSTVADCITDVENSQLGGQRLIHIYQSTDQIISVLKTYSHNIGSSHRNHQVAIAFMKAISAYYSDNPSPFSIDLVQAVDRQQEFNIKTVKEIEWKDGHRIAHGIRQYHKFLQLFITHPGEIMVPTLEVDLAWHTHMLHPQLYQSFTLNYIGRVINHDDNIEPKKLKEYAKRTNEAWQSTSRGYPLMSSYDKDSNSDKPDHTGVFNSLPQSFPHVSNPGYIPATLPVSNTSHLKNTSRTSVPPTANHRNQRFKGLKATWKTIVKVGTIAIGILIIICPDPRYRNGGRGGGGGGTGCGDSGCGGGGCGGGG